MFARVLTVSLKPGQASGYSTFIDSEAIPCLRTFSGFRDQITMVSPDGRQSVAMSFWDTPREAEVYHRDGYSQLLKSLDPFVEGKPVVVTYDVTNSTVHHIRAGAAGASGT